MPRKHHPATIWSQYLGARFAEMCVTMFDVGATLNLAGAIGRFVHRVDRRHRERCRFNLRASFPEWSQEKVNRVTEQTFEHLLKLVFEVCYTPRNVHLDTWSNHARIVNLGSALRMLNARRPCIVLTGHLGNWEVLGYILAVLGYDINALARPIDNPLINDWLLGIRERKGLKIITKWDATDRMLAVLRSGGALGFIADQNAGDRGMFVPFFGRLASTYKSIGLLAMRKQVPVVCGYAHRIETPGAGFKFEIGVVDVIEPEDWANLRDPLYYITARYCRALETMIRMKPEQYLWMHRRWKSRPRHEREGKPMPASLQRNLEALPWMTPDALERLKQPAPVAR
jgi:KDO2-lipid IV(A) lauroyltransferase